MVWGVDTVVFVVGLIRLWLMLGYILWIEWW